MLEKPIPQPKPDRDTKSRERLRKGAAFRDAVWKRDREGFNVEGREWGRCFKCGWQVTRGEGGEVDHIKPRSVAPELIYEPSNGRLSCHDCNQRRKTNWREKRREHGSV